VLSGLSALSSSHHFSRSNGATVSPCSAKSAVKELRAICKKIESFHMFPCPLQFQLLQPLRVFSPEDSPKCHGTLCMHAA